MTAQRAHQTVFMNHTEQGEEHRGYQDTKQAEKCTLHLEYECSFVCSVSLQPSQDLATHVRLKSGARIITFLQTEAAVKIIEMLSTYCSIFQWRHPLVQTLGGYRAQWAHWQQWPGPRSAGGRVNPLYGTVYPPCTTGRYRHSPPAPLLGCCIRWWSWHRPRELLLLLLENCRELPLFRNI